jgi:hypothetical protein
LFGPVQQPWPMQRFIRDGQVAELPVQFDCGRHSFGSAAAQIVLDEA